MEDVWKIS